jgi:hypothetical protein
MDNWDLKIPIVLWAYRNKCNNLKRKTSFRSVYWQEAVVSLVFLVPTLQVVVITNMTEKGTINERLNKIMEMEEGRILEGFHQEVEKERDKA